MAVTEKDVRKALKEVKDPELGLDLVVLGLIYDIEIEDTQVKATISLTSPFCPVAGQIVEDVKTAIEGVDGVALAVLPFTKLGVFAHSLEKVYLRGIVRYWLTSAPVHGQKADTAARLSSLTAAVVAPHSIA